MKPRIQYVNAAGPAGWITDAWTTKSTIARKMIDMSSELRTLGSMPGAIRSDTIARSSASAATTPPPRTSSFGAQKLPSRAGRCRGCGHALKARVGEQPGKQLRAHRDRLQLHVLV